MAITFANAEAPNEHTDLIPKHCPIPVRKSFHLDSKDVKDGHLSVIFSLVHATGSSGTIQLAKLALSDLGSDAKISVSCHIHRDGAVHVALTDKTSGKVDQLDIGKKTAAEE